MMFAKSILSLAVLGSVAVPAWAGEDKIHDGFASVDASAGAVAQNDDRRSTVAQRTAQDGAGDRLYIAERSTTASLGNSSGVTSSAPSAGGNAPNEQGYTDLSDGGSN